MKNEILTRCILSISFIVIYLLTIIACFHLSGIIPSLLHSDPNELMAPIARTLIFLCLIAMSFMIINYFLYSLKFKLSNRQPKKTPYRVLRSKPEAVVPSDRFPFFHYQITEGVNKGCFIALPSTQMTESIMKKISDEQDALVKAGHTVIVVSFR